MRPIRAITRNERLHGADSQATEGGTLLRFTEVSQGQALAAFDQVVRNPGTFEIITRDRTRIAFGFGHGGLRGAFDRMFGRPIEKVTLDIWFEEEPVPPLVDLQILTVASARTFVERIYRDTDDAELWRFLGLPGLAA
jgi:hypothetical protein